MKIKIIVVFCAVLYLVAFGIVKANAGQKKTLFYKLPKGTTVLAFVGEPHSLNVQAVKFTSYEDQAILLFHRKSGRGIWAFYLKGFVHHHPTMGRVEISHSGYFIISKRKIRSTGWR